MIHFMDTSALVKCYIEEPGSDKVQECLDRATVIAVSRLAYIEMLSALVRRRPSLRNCPDDQFKLLLESFRRDWKHFTVLGINEETLLHSDRLIETHCLRGADSIHLSTALSFQIVTKNPILFVASDRELLKAASAERLMILDPTV